MCLVDPEMYTKGEKYSDTESDRSISSTSFGTGHAVLTDFRSFLLGCHVDPIVFSSALGLVGSADVGVSHRSTEYQAKVTFLRVYFFTVTECGTFALVFLCLQTIQSF